MTAKKELVYAVAMFGLSPEASSRRVQFHELVNKINGEVDSTRWTVEWKLESMMVSAYLIGAYERSRFGQLVAALNQEVLLTIGTHQEEFKIYLK